MSETRLELQIVENSKSAIAALDNLANALGRVSSAVSRGFANVSTKNIQRFGQAISNAVTQTTVRNYERLAQALESVSKAASKVPNLQSLQNTIGKVNEATSGLVPKKSETSRLGGDIEKQIESIAPAAKEAASANHTLRDRFRELFATTSGAKRNMGGLLSSFARIAKYRFLRAVLKEITEGFKFGFENMYQYAKYVGHSFAPAVDSAQNALFKMKNSIGAALAPAIQMLIPYLVQAVNWFINLLNIVNQFLSLLRGQSTWTRATNASASTLDKVKDSAKGASASVKELKGLLADWDELNIIQQETGGGGGSGAGSKADEDNSKYGLLFEEVQTFDENIQKVFEKFKPVVSWIQEHLETIKELALYIAAAFALWKIGNALINGLANTIRHVLGIAIALYGAVKALEEFKDQWNNGISFDNMIKMFEGLMLVTAGLGIAFGTTGLAIGFLISGVIAVINPIKELIETGNLSKEAMIQLAVGIGLVAAGISLFVNGSILGAVRMFAGMAIAIYSVIHMLKQLKDQWENGINWENLKSVLASATGIVAGLGLAFGLTGLGVGLLLSGILLITTPLKELIETGTLSSEAMVQLAIGVGMVGASMTLLTTGSIGKTIAVFAGLAIAAYGATNMFKAFKEQWELGINLENVKDSIAGATLVVSGLGIAFGKTGIVIGLFVAGIVLIINPLKQLIETGYLSQSAMIQLAVGVGLVASAITILTKGSILTVARNFVGIAIAVYGAAEAFMAFKDQWNNGVDIDNMKSLLSGLGLVALGLGVAFGITGLEIGLLIGGIVAAISPIKELIETGKLCDESLTQLSIAIGAVGVAISLMTGSWIPLLIAGIAVGVAWVVQKWDAIVEWWNTNIQPALDFVVQFVDKFVIQPIIGFFKNLFKRIRSYVNLIGSFFTLLWESTIYPVVNWIDLNIIQPIIEFFGNLWKLIKGEDNPISEWWEDLWYNKIGGVVEWIKTNVVDKITKFFKDMWKSVRDVFDWITGANQEDSFINADYTGWGRKELYQDIARKFDDDSTHSGKIRKALAYEIDMNGGQAIDINSDAARSIVNSLIQAFVNEEFGESSEYILETIKNELGWGIQDIVDLIDFSSLDTEQLTDLMESLSSLSEQDGIEYILDIDESSFDVALPGPDTSEFVSGIDNATQQFVNDVQEIVDAASSLDGMSFSFTYEGTGYGAWNGMAPRIPKRANGGFVTTGDMFIANEAGPELVGTIGGRTAVANEGQIVAGISSGVAAASRGQERLLVNIIDRLERIEQKEFTAKAVPSSGWGKFNRISNEMYARNTGR